MKTKLSPKKFLRGLGYKLYVDDDVVETMPMDEGVCEFLNLDEGVSEDELEKEYKSRGLVPASPYAMLSTPQSKLDEMKYVGTHWKDKDGKWCYSTFRQGRDVERSVSVLRFSGGWRDVWWFAGLRKSSSIKPSELSDTQDLALRVERLEKIVDALREVLSL